MKTQKLFLPLFTLTPFLYGTLLIFRKSLWGISFLNTTPSIQALFIILMTAGLHPGFQTVFLADNKKLFSNLLSSRKQAPWHWILGYVSILSILWMFRERRVWGDGISIIRLLYQGPAQRTILTNPFSEIFERLIHQGFYHFSHSAMGWTPQISVGFLNCLYGATVILLYFIASRYICIEQKYRILFFGLLVANGSIQVCFGHIEFYTSVHLFSLLFIILILKNYSDASLQKTPDILIALTGAIAVLFHVESIFLFPGLIVLWITPGDLRGTLLSISKRGFLKTFIPMCLSIALVFVILISLGIQSPQIGWNRFGRDPHVFLDIHTVFSWTHFLDVFNILFRNCFLWPLYLVIILSSVPTAIQQKDKPLIYLYITTFLYLFFILVFDTKLTPEADWDLFAITTIPITMSGLYTIARYRSKFIHYLPILLLVSFLNSSIWIFSNHFQQTSGTLIQQNKVIQQLK